MRLKFKLNYFDQKKRQLKTFRFFFFLNYNQIQNVVFDIKTS